MADPGIMIASQNDVQTHGYAIQCRVTTEDAANGFVPDYGRVAHYRSAAGMGIRLDAGTAFSGAVVFPYYDSLLVKVTAWARRFQDATMRMERCLQEFRVRGVKTNLPFLIKLVMHPTFCDGQCTTRFIDQTPELIESAPSRDRATKVLAFLAETIVNGNRLVKDRPRSIRRSRAPVPTMDALVPVTDGTRQRLKTLGPDEFACWIRGHKALLLTDTTFRDAHQSLLATRMRTYDLLQIADVYAHLCSDLFSLEMWGGATFDTSMRFLKECPWRRLTELRERIPNILFQMLLRASNAVGYTNYPDNIVKAFVREAADAGIDVFRIFDALNWLPNMRVAMEAALETGALCEAAVCYTGDILNPDRTKYDLKYYVHLAKELERMGAHILAIKDMAGLCKPYAAQLLVETLKQEIGIPVHFHTHDTAGTQVGAVLKSAEVGLDIADAAMAPLSGGTSQPNLNTLLEALRFTRRQSSLDARHLGDISEYWRAVREFYTPFETPVLPAGADLYEHEMPGGQYTNLFQQARSLGLADSWSKICRAYAEANQMLGDIVKVTPTSKAVGDMALFMVGKNLTAKDILDGNRDLAFPQSVIDLVSGKMGQAVGGFPEGIRESVLRGEEPLQGRPGATLPSADFDQAAATIQPLLDREPSHRETISYLLYPRVFEDFAVDQRKYGDTSVLPTPVFLYGLEPAEEIAVDIEPGKTLIIKFLAIGEPHADGQRTVFFELNGQPREVSVLDRSREPGTPRRPKADGSDNRQVAASMPGLVVTMMVQPGDVVAKGQKLLMLEAMKMQTTILAEQAGKVGQVLVEAGMQVDAGDLLLTIE